MPSVGGGRVTGPTVRVPRGWFVAVRPKVFRAYSSRMNKPTRHRRPLRFAAAALLPLVLIAGCSHSDGDTDATASAEATDDSYGNSPTPAGTPEPTAMPTAIIETFEPPTPDSDAAVGDGDMSADQLPPTDADGDAVGLDSGLAVQITGMRAEELTGSPGEIGGSGIIVSITVGNNTDADVSLTGLVVTASYGADGTPAESTTAGTDAVPASLAPGEAINLEFGFVVPVDDRSVVNVVVDSGADSRAAVFVGSAPTS